MSRPIRPSISVVAVVVGLCHTRLWKRSHFLSTLAALWSPLVAAALYIAVEQRVLRPLTRLAESLRSRNPAGLDDLLAERNPLGQAAQQASRLLGDLESCEQALIAQRQIVTALHERLEQFAGINANLPGIIYRVVLEPDGCIRFPPIMPYGNNPGTPHPQAVHWLDRIHPDDRAAFYEVLRSSAEQQAPFDLEQRVVGSGDENVWVRNISWPQRRADGSIAWDGILLDITAQKGSEMTLQRSLHEKEVLLQEIHHRVKNNLQIIASLLDLQALSLTDPQTQLALADSQQRVQAMALVHQQLYHSDDLAHIDFAAYVQTLLEHLLQFGTTASIQVTLDINAVALDTETAIPCALIINELVSNALKHAFPDGRAGSIRISCHHNEQRQLVLSVSDNGVGMPANYRQLQGNTLGLKLVATLARQLRGLVAIDLECGTAVSVTLPPS